METEDHAVQKTMELIIIPQYSVMKIIVKLGETGKREMREGEREREGNSLPQRKTQDYQGSLIMYRIFQYSFHPVMGKYDLSTCTY